MRVRSGVTIAQAIAALETVISASQEVTNSHAAAQRQVAYLNWVNTAQTTLSYVFSDTEITDQILSRGYWHIAYMPVNAAQLGRLISEEVVCQAGHANIQRDRHGLLGDAVAALKTLLPLAGRDGTICVPETNALMHYTRFDQLDWPSRTRVPLVRLVIPVAVVAEIDNKKYARRGEFSDRARDLLALIDGYASGSPDGYATVREGVTVEILPDEAGHVRLGDPDQEILDRCDLLHKVTGQPVTLINGDSAARINARVTGISVFKLTQEDLLPRYRPETSAAAQPVPSA